MGEVFQDHFFYRYTRPEWPVWFDEGLAEYFGSFEIQGNQVKIGVLNPAKVAYLVNAMDTKTMVSLRALLNSSPSAYNGERMNMYYAASWGLTRFLIEHEEYAKRLPRFVEALREGEAGLTAFEENFGKDLEKLEDSWIRWLQEVGKPSDALTALSNGRTIDEWAIHEGGIWWVEDAAIHGESDGSYNYLIRSTFPRESFRLHLQTRLDSGSAGIVLGNNFHGEYPYYFLIDIESHRISVRESHSPTRLTTIATSPIDLPRSQWRNFDVEVHDGRLRVSMEGEVLIDVPEERIRYSIVGLYLSGGKAQFRDLLIGPPAIRPAAPGSVSP